MMKFRPVTHVLFDMDGLILKTEDLYEIGYQTIASRYNRKLTFPLKCKVSGMQINNIACLLVKELQLPLNVEQFLTEIDALFRKLFPQAQTLPDTEELYEIGFKKVASRYGKEFTFALKCKIMGQQSREFAKSIIDDLGLPLTVDQFLAETRAIFDELFPQSEILPGVERLIRHLHDNKVPIGLATSSSKESYSMKVGNKDHLFSLLKYKTWGSSDPDVKRGKPFPDIFLVAAGKFPDKPRPEKCLVFEDSVNGVRAARAAGMQAVMVPDPRLPTELAAEATLVLPSIELFRPEDFGLPPFRD